ncbi:TolB-like protein/class 3 adenylate cyclase/Flp pilus assembly protein TadD [Rhizobium mesoamericanum]|uniref:adenylate/guanylate cyclase domain-containing protein n=1 Tax=Rhizobium mesoamericanum TaxID=1079800 RepID=UPI00278A02AD|nr:adenylate/guanylate cyclase domain-containing protein [Rhizobium mesoamericanum]MDQ0562006.1 TolB-like protein/class 3 adenylate cyclase/Flp pilus assembly protein TadD [Rhizobium mesoamericanum]
MERRLTAILSADVVGYSRLMGVDESGTLERLKACRRDLIDSTIEKHHGRIIKLMGDGALVEFPSVVDAVQCAAVIQRGMPDRNHGISEDKRIQFRIGVNLGDIIVEGDDIYGDGVNIAARLQGIAEPGGILISGTTFDHVAHKVDVGFASLGEKRLKNITDPVRVYRVLLDPSKTGKVVPGPRRVGVVTLSALAALVAVLFAIVVAFVSWQWASPQRPSLAVLPFANLSDDQTQDYFADGITDDLITDLAALSNLDVISQNSVFGYKGKSHDLKQIGRELGVRYVVEGSLQRRGDLIRVNAQLIDTSSGNHLWAHRFEGGASDVFAVQDEMGRQIADALGLKLTRSETERISRPPTTDLEAYDYYLRAEQAARTGRRSRMLEALALFDKAEKLDGSFAEAFAADAHASAFVWRMAYDDVLQSALARKRAYDKASRALALDPDLPSPYAVLAIMQAVDRRYEQAIASAQKAVALGPANSEAHMAVAYVQLVWGNHADAAAAVEVALRYDPNPSAIDRYTAGMVFFLQHDYKRATDSFQRARDGSENNGDFVAPLAMAYVRAGRIEDARATVKELSRLRSGRECLAGWRIANANLRSEDLAFTLDALREAGLPEWPFGFHGDEQARLMGGEIAAIVMGKVLRGMTEPSKSPAIMQVQMDGKAAFRSQTQMMTETVSVKGDLLCEQSENAFGQASCGPVYRPAKTTEGATYTYVNSTKVFYFSPAD